MSILLYKVFVLLSLSEKETLRRAGQMARFISLVLLEYGRGIHHGQVVVDLEIREARFHFGMVRRRLQTLEMNRDNSIKQKQNKLLTSLLTWEINSWLHRKKRA